MIDFRKATQEDINIILENAREENHAEIEVIEGLTLDRALGWSLGASSEAYVAVIDGDPVCAFGVVPNKDPEVGTPWMVGTTIIDRHAVEFLRGSKKVINDLLTRWPVLRNYADTRNIRGIRWLKFMGFTVYSPQLINGMPFHQFEKRSQACARV